MDISEDESILIELTMSATSTLYRNLKSTWNSVMPPTLKRIYVFFMTLKTKKKYHLTQQPYCCIRIAKVHDIR